MYLWFSVLGDLMIKIVENLVLAIEAVTQKADNVIANSVAANFDVNQITPTEETMSKLYHLVL